MQLNKLLYKLNHSSRHNRGPGSQPLAVKALQHQHHALDLILTEYDMMSESNKLDALPGEFILSLNQEKDNTSNIKAEALDI